VKSLAACRGGASSEKFRGEVPQPDDVKGAIPDVKAHRALDDAGQAIGAGDRMVLDGFQVSRGGGQVPVTVGIHVTAHESRNVWSGRTLFQSGPASLAEKAVFTVETRQSQRLCLLGDQGEVFHDRKGGKSARRKWPLFFILLQKRERIL
jgi:hypothetical protein